MNKLILLSILILIIFINFYAMKQNSRNLEVQNICRIFTQEGLPTAAIINGNRYDLTGKNIFQKMFINQFDREQLQNLKECIQIEVRKNK